MHLLPALGVVSPMEYLASNGFPIRERIYDLLISQNGTFNFSLIFSFAFFILSGVLLAGAQLKWLDSASTPGW